MQWTFLRANGLAFFLFFFTSNERVATCGCHLLSCLEKPFTVLRLHRRAVDSLGEISRASCNSFHIHRHSSEFHFSPLDIAPPSWERSSRNFLRTSETYKFREVWTFSWNCLSNYPEYLHLQTWRSRSLELGTFKFANTKVSVSFEFEIFEFEKIRVSRFKLGNLRNFALSKIRKFRCKCNLKHSSSLKIVIEKRFHLRENSKRAIIFSDRDSGISRNISLEIPLLEGYYGIP